MAAPHTASWMSTFVASAAAYSVLGILLTAGGLHLARPGPLRSALSRQDTPLSRVPAQLAMLVGLTELGLAAIGLIALIGAIPRHLATPALASSAVLFSVYSGYLWFLIRWRPDAPCGCTSGTSPASSWAIGRALMLAALATLAALLSDAIATRLAGGERAIAVVAALAMGVTLWILPDALAAPASMRQVRAAR